MCFCTKSKLDKQNINYFILVLLDILKSSLRHNPFFISVCGTEDSSSDSSILLLQSFLCLFVDCQS